MKYCKVKLINGEVYDFDKKCKSINFDYFGFVTFSKNDTKIFNDVLMYINKTEIRRIEWVDDSEEVENLSNQESKIEWITDRLPTKEECDEGCENQFLITINNPSYGVFITADDFEFLNGEWKSWKNEDVIAWAKVKPYIK